MNTAKNITIVLWVVLGLNFLFFGNVFLNYFALALLAMRQRTGQPRNLVSAALLL